MNDFPQQGLKLPPEQQAIRNKCFHPSGTFIEFPKEDVEKSIPERFEKIVARFPDRVAIQSKNQTMTYSQLNQAANDLAHIFLAQHGERQKPVALFFERGVQLIVANLAILKTGNIAMQVDPAAPRARIAHLLDDSRTTLVLTNRKNRTIASQWAGGSREVLDLDELDFKNVDQNVQLSIRPGDYANLTYTSGSLGKAKGMLKTHHAILHMVMNFTNACHICADDRLAVFGRGAISRNLFNGLLNGATQHLLDRDTGFLHLSDRLIQEGITVFMTLPTAFRHFVNVLPLEKRFPRLRLIRLSGEPSVKADLELYKKHFSTECILVNSYGAQETGEVCLYFFDKNTIGGDNRLPVGYPIEGVKVFVLDERGKKANYDQPGEIAVRSRFLSRGYWHATKRQEKDLLFGRERSYRTGDFGKMSRDGCLTHLGRKDLRVKIRSFRVDTGEVEAILSDHPDVKQGAVVAKNLPSGDATLIAYFVPHGEHAPTVTSLRHFLNERLPDYMVPSSFVTLAELPLTATGKVDRRALPDPGPERPKLDTPYAQPTTLIEMELASIWAKVLSLQNVGIHDQFLDLGGHSLSAMRIVSHVIQKFQFELPLQFLFESATVAEMAAVIAERQGKKLAGSDLKKILAEIESMSDEEAQRLVHPLRNWSKGTRD